MNITQQPWLVGGVFVREEGDGCLVRVHCGWEIPAGCEHEARRRVLEEIVYPNRAWAESMWALALA